MTVFSDRVIRLDYVIRLLRKAFVVISVKLHDKVISIKLRDRIVVLKLGYGYTINLKSLYFWPVHGLHRHGLDRVGVIVESMRNLL